MFPGPPAKKQPSNTCCLGVKGRPLLGPPSAAVLVRHDLEGTSHATKACSIKSTRLEGTEACQKLRSTKSARQGVYSLLSWKELSRRVRLAVYGLFYWRLPQARAAILQQRSSQTAPALCWRPRRLRPGRSRGCRPGALRAAPASPAHSSRGGGASHVRHMFMSAESAVPTRAVCQQLQAHGLQRSKHGCDAQTLLIPRKPREIAHHHTEAC